MRITRKQFTVRQVAEGYKNNEENGVVGFGGLLNIRPAYQREFVYDDKKRNAVISTIRKGFPLNVMYWSKNDDGTYELLDGQQRTISFCKYVAGEYSIDGEYFHTLTDAEQDEILDYTLDIFVCEGNDKERLDWFRTINIAGEKLTEQELLNANYTGKWLSDAKRRFSKTNCVAYKVGKDYVNGSPIRQDFLETALDWISDGHIEDYMAAHQHDENSDELLEYFQNVMEWVANLFDYRSEMKGLAWGKLYNKYHNNEYSPAALEGEISILMSNEEISDKKGIYEYVLSGCDGNLAKKLSYRKFDKSMKRTAYERQCGIDPVDGLRYDISEMEAHHIYAWNDGGRTELDNCVMLSKDNHKKIHNGLMSPAELKALRDNLFE